MEGIAKIVNLIGKEMWYKSGGLMYIVVVKDFRMRYGVIDGLITPLGGKGEKWVEFGNLFEMEGN